MAKFHPQKCGRGDISTYNVNLGKEKLKRTGFLLDDGTLLEFEVDIDAEKKTITLKHKENSEG